MIRFHGTKRTGIRVRIGVEALELRALPTGTPTSTYLWQLSPNVNRDWALSQTQQLSVGSVAFRETGIPGLYALEGPEDDLRRLSDFYLANAAADFIEPMGTVSLALNPNDPYYTNGSLWGLNGANGINAPAAWDVVTGSTKVIMADIDTGIDYTHPDLYKNIWVNQGEIPPARLGNLTDVDGDGLITFWDLNEPVNQGVGKITDLNGNGRIDGGDLLFAYNANGTGGWADGVSQDGNSYVDDLIGWNFVNNTNNPFDDHSHGTHTVGTIVGMGNNGLGVAGVNWKGQIMAVKFLSSSGSGSTLNGALSIRYAADKGARVSNNSWGGGGFSTTLQQAIEYAADLNHVVVAAAGNNSSNNDSSPFYPASYNVNNVIAVAATTSTGALSSFSNYGATTVDLGAPGSAIVSTVPGGYASFSGTSMAAPHVTGVVGLILDRFGNQSFPQLINQVLNTTRAMTSLQGITVTGGIVDASQAVANPVPLRYDFGTSSSPVASGYVAVPSTRTFSTTVGFGWSNGTITGVDRGSGSAVTRDFNSTTDGTFAVRVGNGNYQVTVTIGDASFAQTDMGISLEGSQVDTVNVAAGQFLTRSYVTTVTDSRLELRIWGLAGAGSIARINGLQIVPTNDVTGPRVTAYTPTGNVVGPVDRVTLTFNEAIQDGTFTLADVVSLTGPSGAITATAVNKITATQYEVTFASQTTPGPYALTVGPQILDVAGNAMDQNQNGTNGEVPGDRHVSTFTINDNAPPPAPLNYDFGIAGSPTGSGYTAIVPNTTYNETQGYGWVSGTIDGRDRGIGTVLQRDFNFATDGTFGVRLENGTYEVTVTIGDADYGQLLMGVQLEGIQVDTLSVPTGDYLTRSYVTTVADGRLDLRIWGLAGAGSIGRINALAIASSEDVTGPRVVSYTPSGNLSGAVDRITLTFNEAILEGSFTLVDVHGLTGPNGAITPTAVNRLAAAQYEVVFDSQSTLGTYTLVIGPQIEDLAGNAMDQNDNGTNGEVPGDRHTSTFTLVEDSPAPTLYDFGIAGSPTGSGYTAILPGTTYNETQGYGWVSGVMDGRDRGTGTVLQRDFNFTPDGVFGVRLENGTYEVTVTIGDADYGQLLMGVELEGIQVDTLSVPTGDYLTRSYVTTVADGRLDLRIWGMAGSGSIGRINALAIASTSDSIGPRVVSYTPNGDVVGAVDRITLTFNEAILEGSFTLDDVVSLNGPEGAITPTAVNRVAATQYEVVFANQTTLGTYTLVVGPQVLDEAGNAMDQNNNGSNGEDPGDLHTSSFTIVEESPAPRLYDFGIAGSPLGSGFTAVLSSTTYNETQGYGWVSGVIDGRDRGIGTVLQRDFNFSPDAVFGVRLANGTYEVTITVGDADYGQLLMGVELEGIQVDALSVPTGEYLTRTYETTVTDGRLDLRIWGMAGAGSIGRINALEINDAGDSGSSWWGGGEDDDPSLSPMLASGSASSGEQSPFVLLLNDGQTTPPIIAPPQTNVGRSQVAGAFIQPPSPIGGQTVASEVVPLNPSGGDSFTDTDRLALDEIFRSWNP